MSSKNGKSPFREMTIRCREDTILYTHLADVIKKGFKTKFQLEFKLDGSRMIGSSQPTKTCGMW